MSRHEEVPASTVASVRAMALGRPTDEDFSRALLGIGLYEANRSEAEQLCRWYARNSSGDSCRAALLALAHLARRFGDCDGATWALVDAVRDDQRFAGTWADVADDLRQFVRTRSTWTKPVLTIRGAEVDGLAAFWVQIDGILQPGVFWGRNLDAFNDILRGGFGTPDDGFVMRWTDAGHCRTTLGHAETARWLEGVLKTCHPSNRGLFNERLEAARIGEGETLFDVLVHIIGAHGPGGEEHLDFVDLELVE